MPMPAASVGPDLKPSAINKRARDEPEGATQGSAAARLPPARRPSSPTGGAPSPLSTGAGATTMRVSGRRAESQARRVKLGAQNWHVQSIECVSGDTIEVKWEGFERTSEHSRASLMAGAFDATKIQAMIDAREKIGWGDDAGGTDVSPEEQQIVDLSSAVYSDILASHVMPGAPLGAFAMVCVEWWKAARVLNTYTKSGFFAFVWSPPQLMKYFQRLPELEPDLHSPGLLIPSDSRENGADEEAGAKHSWASAWSAGDDVSAMRIYDGEKEVIRQICDMTSEGGVLPHPDKVRALWDEGSTTRNRAGTPGYSARYRRYCSVLRGDLCLITDAAIRRLARLGGVSRFSTAIYKEARGTLRSFLYAIQHNVLEYFLNLSCCRVRRGTVTSEDVARVLELRGCQPPVHSLQSLQRPGVTAGFFARIDESEHQQIEEDDLTHPEPQHIMPYLFAFGQLTEEIFTSFCVSHPASHPSISH